MSDLINRLRRYSTIQWEILKIDCKEVARYDEESFSHGFVSGQITEGKRMITDIQSTFPDIDKDMAPDVSIESLKGYASRQRGALRKNKEDLKGFSEKSYDQAFSCGLVRRGEQAIINLYTICRELGSVDSISEIWEA